MSDICFECGGCDEIHYHHVVPKVLGGTKTVPLCIECHGKVHGVEFINHRRLTREGLANAKKRGVNLGSPQNLTESARNKGLVSVKRNKTDNKNWNQAKEFISKINIKNLSEMSRLLNENGYRTRHGCLYSAGTVKRLLNNLE